MRMAACHPKGPCPEGYHDTDENETGQCYPNSEGCDAHIIKDGIRYDYQSRKNPRLQNLLHNSR